MGTLPALRPVTIHPSDRHDGGRVTRLGGFALSIEERHVALPQLVGASARMQRPHPVPAAPRPFDPDDLPLEVARTAVEADLAASLTDDRTGPSPEHPWFGLPSRHGLAGLLAVTGGRLAGS